MKQKVFFRADGSKEIGFGHFIRSLALAEILGNDFDCTFFTQTPSDFQKEEVNKVCKLIELPADDTKYEIFLQFLTGKEIVVLDNYFYTPEYEKAIKEIGCRIVSIGTNDRHYYADVVVNFTKLQSADFSAEEYTRFCLGLEWTILRKPFYENYEKTRSDRKGFVICIGGTDQYAFSEKFYTILSKFYPNESITIIVTDRIGHQRIRAFQEKGVTLRQNLTAKQMAVQFAESAVAIVSASGVAIEALSQKVAVIAGYYIENQVNIYRALQMDNYIWGIGNYNSPFLEKNLASAISSIHNKVQKNEFVAVNTLFRYKELFHSLC